MALVGLLVLAAVGLGGLYLLCGMIVSLCRAEKLHAADAAVRMLEKRGGSNPELPEKLRGVFWFNTNKAAELLMTFEGEKFDAARRRVYITSGGIYSWTYSASFGGFIYWFILRVGNLCCFTLHVNFEDEELTSAIMPLYLCNLCWFPMGMTWTLVQIDENTWDRPIYLWCTSGKWEKGSYVLKRIIDGDGNKLPAFDEMVRSVEEKVPGIPKKPAMQIMNGTSCGSCFGNPVPGKAGYQELP